tara:strand:- start:56711 stop:57661 length:951 start_codon:yes stop_codon:yes gene_type:complete
MKVSEVLSAIDRSDLQDLLQKSDLKAFSILIFNWLVIALCFGAVMYFPYWWIWPLSAFVLGGRILGLAILMHDCAHDAFFKTKGLNRFFGKWFCAAPVLADLDRYRTYHLEHHRTAGSDADPDRPNYIGYPVSVKSFKRKMLRDLFGITGFKLTLLILKMNAGTVKYQLSYDGSKTAQVALSTQIKNICINLGPSLLIHFVAAYFLGTYYLLFWLSWLSFYMVFSRIRNAAEHGATINTNDLNPLLNTRTTLAHPWERLSVAPNYVNYHLEHHLLPAIPSYHLGRFHKLLMHKKVLSGSKVASGYREVIRDLISDT